jgi:hypothetical protein
LVRACEDYVLDRWQSIAIAPEPKVELRRGETFHDGIEARRRRIRELKSDLAKARAAPLPSREAKAAIRARVDALASRGRPVVTGILERYNEQIEWPQTTSIRADNDVLAPLGCIGTRL